MIQRGFLEVPEDADPVTFLLSAGRSHSVPQLHPTLTFCELFSKYKQSLLVLAKEKTALSTEKTKIKRCRNHLPLSHPLAPASTEPTIPVASHRSI
jgi:hypothetical protein